MTVRRWSLARVHRGAATTSHAAAQCAVGSREQRRRRLRRVRRWRRRPAARTRVPCDAAWLVGGGGRQGEERDCKGSQSGGGHSVAHRTVSVRACRVTVVRGGHSGSSSGWCAVRSSCSVRHGAQQRCWRCESTAFVRVSLPPSALHSRAPQQKRHTARITHSQAHSPPSPSSTLLRVATVIARPRAPAARVDLWKPSRGKAAEGGSTTAALHTQAHHSPRPSPTQLECTCNSSSSSSHSQVGLGALAHHRSDESPSPAAGLAASLAGDSTHALATAARVDARQQERRTTKGSSGAAVVSFAAAAHRCAIVVGSFSVAAQSHHSSLVLFSISAPVLSSQ